MKNLCVTSLLAMAFLCSAQAQQIVVSNPSAQSRKELISIPYAQFNSFFKRDTSFRVTDAAGNTVPHQLERLGQSTPVNVLVQVAVGAKETLKLAVAAATAEPLAAKTYARYVPERFDDFAWENDLVAFRMYGKALEGRKDDAQGMDYWAKRTDKLVINSWYKSDNYHKDHGDGMDYYSVGQSLGAGDVGFYIDSKLQYSKHYRQFQVLDNGPLRSTFRLAFDTERIDGQEISMSKTISLDAGSHFNKIVLHINNSEKPTTAIAIGIVKRKEEAPRLTLAKGNNSLSYWEPPINDSGETGVAVFFPKASMEYNNDSDVQALMIGKVANGRDFVYYNGAAWNRAGQATDAASWNKLVDTYKENHKKPLKVVLKK